MKHLFSFLLLLIFAFNSSAQGTGNLSTQQLANTPKNVILLIGDGMGATQVFTLMSVQKNNAFEQFKHIGFQKTSSTSHFITESSAAATAMSTGKKTNNPYISIDPETKQPLQTLVQLSNAKGLSTGIVAACDIMHATPAAFLAHNINRNNYEELAADMLNTHPTLFIGGGKNRFEKRKDNRNLTDSLKKQGFQVFYTLSDLQQTQNPKVAGLLYDMHPESMVNGRGEYLKPASQKAIELLNQNPKGFFMMIEGAQIDWEAHDNRFEAMVEELKDFDNTIQAVLEFAKKDGNTLVIVTGDHETGGLTLPKYDQKLGIMPRYTTFDHTAVMIPVFAFGPGAEEFAGIYENTEIQKKICNLLNLN
ncbi:MAG: alkaline phosphatase [Bacteroidales bacterium]|jgi:alkaline phosphatase|nr:alkaline phosphatase [Bacteroidales bacterium]